MLRLDDYYNSSLRNVVLGQAQRYDRLSATDVGMPTVLTDSQRALLYRVPLFRRAVDIPPNDCTRRGWTAGSKLDKEYRRLDIRRKINVALKYSRIRGRAGLVCVLQDGRNFDQPVDPALVSSVRMIHVAAAGMLRRSSTSTRVEDNPEHAQFGQPVFWDWRQTRSSSPITVHRDRVIWVDGMLCDPEDAVAMRETDRNMSVIDHVWEPVRNYLIAIHGVATTVAEFHYTVFGVKDLAELLTSGPGPDGQTGEEALLERFEVMAESRSMLNAYLMDAEREKVERLGAPVRGLPECVYALMADVCMATAEPITKLFGQAPSGLSTDDKSGNENWDEHIEARQIDEVEPPLRELSTFIVPSGDFEITFHPLSTPDDETREQARKVWAERIDLLIERKIVTPKEVRHSSLGGPTFSYEIELIPAEEKELEKAWTEEVQVVGQVQHKVMHEEPMPNEPMPKPMPPTKPAAKMSMPTDAPDPEDATDA